MKKTLLAAVLLFTAIANAQEKNEKLVIKKGTWNIAGNLSLDFSNNERRNYSEYPYNTFNESKNFAYNLLPSTSYFISDNLSVGLGVGFGHAFSELSAPNDTRTSNSYSIAPFVKKYFAIGKKVSLSLKGEASYARINTRNNDFDTVNDIYTNSYFIGIKPGITFFVSKNLALETTFGSLGYRNSKNTFSGPSTGVFTHQNESFSFNLQSSDLFFGLSYYF